MTFQHVGDGRDLALEAADGARVIGKDADESRHVLPQAPGVEQGHVARDGAGLLELVDPLDHGWGLEAHLLPDRGERLLAVFLQQLEDRPVGRVELGRKATELHSGFRHNGQMNTASDPDSSNK
jgi:hypothetical protein